MAARRSRRTPHLHSDGIADEWPESPAGVGGKCRSSILRRSGWSFIGQALSSGSNFVLTFLVLATSSAAEFATLSLVLTLYLFLLQLTRALISIPVTILYSRDATGDQVKAIRSATGLTAGLSVLASTAILAATLLLGTRGAQFAVLGAALPILLYQDSLRYVCFARGVPRLAAAGDGLWVVVQALGSAVAFAAGHSSALSLLAIWATAGSISGLFLAVRQQLVPGFMTATRWLRSQRVLCRRLLLDYLVSAGGHYAVYFGLVALSGADQLGRLKAAQLFLGPMAVLLLGGAAVGIPESVRVEGDPIRLRRLTLLLSGILVLVSGGCGIVVYAALPRFGPRLFAASWASARPLVPLLAAFTAALGASTGVISALRALGENAWLLRVRVVSGVVLVVLSVPASAHYGAAGALVALSASEWTVALLAWTRLDQVLEWRGQGPVLITGPTTGPWRGQVGPPDEG